MNTEQIKQLATDVNNVATAVEALKKHCNFEEKAHKVQGCQNNVQHS